MASSTLPLGEGTGGVTVATPAVWLAVVTRRSNAAASAGEVAWPTSSSGPLNPGPKPWATATYAWWVVELGGSVLASEESEAEPEDGEGDDPHDGQRARGDEHLAGLYELRPAGPEGGGFG